jgi:uncharacterized membrane protein YjgN (DUF898 family)
MIRIYKNWPSFKYISSALQKIGNFNVFKLPRVLYELIEFQPFIAKIFTVTIIIILLFVMNKKQGWKFESMVVQYNGFNMHFACSLHVFSMTEKFNTMCNCMLKIEYTLNTMFFVIFSTSYLKY